MMSAAMMAMAAFLLANLVVGLLRAYKGPTLADRMLAMLLFGTTTVGAILLLAYAQDMAALVAVALVFVMLATVVSFTFVQMQGGIHPHGQEGVHPHRQEGVHPHRQEGVHPHRQEGE